MAGGQPGPARTFLRGWRSGSGVWGKPVGPFVARDGNLYLTDDMAGAVYRLRPG
jgi:glucose/arabinose dehydrogenase